MLKDINEIKFVNCMNVDVHSLLAVEDIVKEIRDCDHEWFIDINGENTTFMEMELLGLNNLMSDFGCLPDEYIEQEELKYELEAISNQRYSEEYLIKQCYKFIQ